MRTLRAVGRNALCFLLFAVPGASLAEIPRLADTRFAVPAWPALGVAEKRAALAARFNAVIAGGRITDADERLLCTLLQRYFHKDAQSPACREMGVQALLGPEDKGFAAASKASTWEGAALQGLTDFVVERAKAELRQWVMTGLLDDICPESRPASLVWTTAVSASALMPETCALTRQFAYGHPVTDALFIKSFRADLKALPALLAWRQTGQTWGYVLANYFDGLQRGVPPLLLTAGLAEVISVEEEAGKGNCFKKEANLRGDCALFWVGVLTQAYVWAADTGPDDSLATSMRFIAALYVVLHDAPGDTVTSVASVLTPVVGQALAKGDPALRQLTQRLGTRLRAARVVLDQIEVETDRLKALRASGAGTKEVLASVARIAGLSAQSIADTLELPQALHLLPKVTDDLRQAMQRTRVLAEVGASLSSGQYAEGLGRLWIVLACMTQEEQERQGVDCAGWTKITGLEAPARLLVRHLPIIVGLADAKTPDDFKAMIDNIASPVGAWRFKRHRSMWSITGLVGFHAAQETLSGPGIASYSGQSAGLFAPIGVAYSWPTADAKNAWAVMASIIDLGAPISARLSEKDSDEVSDTSTSGKFRDVISPGIYVMRGFQDSPMVIGLGWSYTPKLRRAQLPSGAEQDVDSRRVGIFIALDLTLFAWHRPR